MLILFCCSLWFFVLQSAANLCNSSHKLINVVWIILEPTALVGLEGINCQMKSLSSHKCMLIINLHQLVSNKLLLELSPLPASPGNLSNFYNFLKSTGVFFLTYTPTQKPHSPGDYIRNSVRHYSIFTLKLKTKIYAYCLLKFALCHQMRNHPGI